MFFIIMKCTSIRIQYTYVVTYIYCVLRAPKHVGDILLNVYWYTVHIDTDNTCVGHVY